MELALLLGFMKPSTEPVAFDLGEKLASFGLAKFHPAEVRLCPLFLLVTCRL